MKTQVFVPDENNTFCDQGQPFQDDGDVDIQSFILNASVFFDFVDNLCKTFDGYDSWKHLCNCLGKLIRRSRE